MANLNWTSESERWLKDIYDYIAADNPQAAGRVLEGIYEKAQILLRFPDAGYSYEGSEEDIRILLYGHYRITYLKRPDRRHRRTWGVSRRIGNRPISPINRNIARWA